MHQCDSGHCDGMGRRGFLASLGALGATFAASCAPHGIRAATPPAAADGLIDVHHHIFPPRYVSPTMQRLMAGISNVPISSSYTSWSPQSSIEKMDAANVRTAMVSVPTGGDWWESKDDPRTVARVSNEFGARYRQDYPGRFGILASLPLPDVDASLKEIAYALDTLKLDGIGIVTSYGGKPVGDPAFAPVFDELNRRKVAVYVHPTSTCCDMPIHGIDLPTIDFPTDTTRAITSLAFSGTFARCPDIKFIFAQGGGTLPSIVYRYGAPMRNFPPEVIKKNLPDGFEAMIRKQYYDISGVVRSLPAMRNVVGQFPISQLMFGSDVPFGSPAAQAAQLAALSEIGLTEADLRAIRRDNARRLFPAFG